MKKLSLLLILVLLVSCIVLPTAYASETEYIKIENNNTIFYSDNYEPLFYLTKDCYVAYQELSGEYVKVKYFDKQGLVKASDVNPDVKVTGLNYYYHNANDATTIVSTYLFSKPSITGATVICSIPQSTKVFPLGKYTDGTDTYVYVSYSDGTNTMYGAISSSHLTWDGIITPPSNNQTPTQTPSGSIDNPNGGGNPSLNPDDTKTPENNLVRILLIIGICVPVLIIVFLIFKPVKPSSNRYASETRRRDDYEDFE